MIISRKKYSRVTNGGGGGKDGGGFSAPPPPPATLPPPPVDTGPDPKMQAEIEKQRALRAKTGKLGEEEALGESTDPKVTKTLLGE